jgi:LmbE family N-acetylglucosaminyl deacetylase
MRILVMTSHPHYAGTYCAGTLYNHAQRGDAVYVVSLTAGELMTNRVSPQELAQINERDMQEAASVLGIKDARILGFPDAEIANTFEVRMALNNAIREIKPDVVITHWPNDTHPDFRETGQAAIDACFFALLVSGKWSQDRPSHWTGKAYAFEYPELSVGFEPSIFVDISDCIETKIKAIDCFAIHCEANFRGDYEKFHSSIIGPNRYWGLESGVTYAEPFAQVKIHEVHNKAGKYLLP